MAAANRTRDGLEDIVVTESELDMTGVKGQFRRRGESCLQSDREGVVREMAAERVSAIGQSEERKLQEEEVTGRRQGDDGRR